MRITFKHVHLKWWKQLRWLILHKFVKNERRCEKARGLFSFSVSESPWQHHSKKPALEKGENSSWICPRETPESAMRSWSNVEKRGQEELRWRPFWKSDVTEDEFDRWRWRQGRREYAMAMTSQKTAAADDDRVCELTTTQVLQSELTPTMLRDSQTLEKGCIWGVRQVLRSDGGLVETQLGCDYHRGDQILPKPELLFVPARGSGSLGCEHDWWSLCPSPSSLSFKTPDSMIAQAPSSIVVIVQMTKSPCPTLMGRTSHGSSSRQPEEALPR